MGKIKENWQIVVFTMLITLAGSLFISWIADRSTHIEDAATTEYVDTKDCELKEQIEQKADKKDVRKIEETLKIIDSRIYDMWKDSHEKQ